MTMRPRNVVMGPCIVNRGPWCVIMGPRNVIMVPLNVNRGLWNESSGLGM